MYFLWVNMEKYLWNDRVWVKYVLYGQENMKIVSPLETGGADLQLSMLFPAELSLCRSYQILCSWNTV